MTFVTQSFGPSAPSGFNPVYTTEYEQTHKAQSNYSCKHRQVIQHDPIVHDIVSDAISGRIVFTKKKRRHGDADADS